MSILQCLRGKGASGLVKREAADHLAEAIEMRMADRAKVAGRIAAEREAAGAVLDEAEAMVSRELLLRADTIRAQIQLARDASAYRGQIEQLRSEKRWIGNSAPVTLQSEQSATLGAALRGKLTRDPWEIETGDNVHYLARSIRGEAHRLMADHLRDMRAKNLGFSERTAYEADVLKALYGAADATPEARALAESWQKAASFLHREHNAVSRGGIAERQDWRLPNPTHEPAKVALTKVDVFVERTLPRLDRSQMLDYATGKPLDDAALRAILAETHQRIGDGGLSAPAARPAGRPMTANARLDHRVLVFKDAESWLAHAGDFGEHQSVFSTMMGHMSAMANDIAMMRVFGPNPNASKDFALALFQREAAGLMVEVPAGARPQVVAQALIANRWAQWSANRARKGFENLWAQVSGEANVPVHGGMAQAMGEMRSWLVASQMGGAILSSISDIGLVSQAARFNDIPAAKVLARYTEGMASGQMEVKAAQVGFVADSFAQMHQAVDRVMGEEIRAGLGAKVGSAVIRASGLRRHSGTLRAAFGLEYQAVVANDLRKSWADLSDARRAAFQRVGLGEEQWAIIQKAEPWHPVDDAPFLRAADIRETGHPDANRIASAYQRLLDTEMDHAVIESGDPITRALIYGESRPGTIGGETRRAVGLYKSFPFTFINLHFARAFARGWDGSRLGHAAITFTAMTAFGILAMQAKEIAKGRDPVSLDPTTSKGVLAYGRGMLQGGGLGIFGDVLFEDKTRFGNSWATTLAGPQFAAVERVLGTTLMGNLQRAAKGEQTHLAGDALYAAGSLMPGSTLWFARLAFERNVLDQMALMIDPRAPERFRRIEDQARKNWGNEHWWRRGETSPERAPDLNRILEAR
ncbi:MAG: hypothetical protein J0L51_00085 [Rhizobiales bacterium]|nr:hypothetical protein [Hyphomicrobiales bacterium]